LFVLTRILQELAGQQTVYAFFLDVKRMIRSGGWSQVARKGVDGKLWRVLRDLAIKSTSQVRVNGDLSEAFPLSAGVAKDYLPVVRYLIDDLVAGLHDTCSEHGICMGQTDVASLLYADDANAYPSPQWLAKLMDYIHTWLNKWRMQEFHQSR
jgi:hypothetical protein